MHGRLKVKTTAEQQEAKRKEREKKLQVYNAVTKKAFDKRKDKCYDEESLYITGEILGSNPDFYTFWNFRKEIFIHLKSERSHEDVQKLFNSELQFLESCLLVNPKSYGVWHHRMFVLDTMPDPDWEKELQLCNKYLEFDERNFHCWDYRRFVVKRSSVSLEREFQFTTDKISNNFSNYSSWHYRSKLLPILYPDPSLPVGVTEEALLQEYETVQNAFFTDPDDQSAWFYHRWLLGRGEKRLGINSLHISRGLRRIVISMSKSVLVGASLHVEVLINGVSTAGKWVTPESERKYSNVWKMSPDDFKTFLTDIHIFTPDEENVFDTPELEINFKFREIPESNRCLRLSESENEACCPTEAKPGMIFSSELSAVTSDTLARELESIKELHQLEPDNKWTVLTIVLLMKALNPLKYEPDIIQLLKKLMTSDPKRVNYYSDLKSKYLVENSMEALNKGQRILDMKDKELSVLYHIERLTLLKVLDISNNKLSSLKYFFNLQCIEELLLDNNKLCDLQGVMNLPALRKLSIKNNLLASIDVLTMLKSCPKLNVLYLEGNPLCSEETYPSQVKAMLNQITNVDNKVV